MMWSLITQCDQNKNQAELSLVLIHLDNSGYGTGIFFYAGRNSALRLWLVVTAFLDDDVHSIGHEEPSVSAHHQRWAFQFRTWVYKELVILNQRYTEITHGTCLFSVAQEIFWMSSERLSRSTYMALCSLTTVGTVLHGPLCEDSDKNDKSPKVAP